MTDEAEELTAKAKRDIANIETAAETPAAQIIALHEVCGSLLDSFNGIPERLTAQAEVLKKFVRVFDSICQHIEEVREEIRSTVAGCKKIALAMAEEMSRMNEKMDAWLEPGQRILLAEAVYTLSSLAVQHVQLDYEHPLSLNQIHSMYTARQLDAGQRRRWEEVMQFVDSHVSIEELLNVDRELRSARYGDAHGTDDEKDAKTEELLEIGAKLYSKEQHPDLHLPLQKMLIILAQFSSNDTPCLPDRTFASKMHHTLLQKIFS